MKYLLVSDWDQQDVTYEFLYGSEGRLHDTREAAQAAADRLTESAVNGDWQGAEPPRYAVAEVEDADAAEWPHNTTAGLSLARLNALEALASG